MGRRFLDTMADCLDESLHSAFDQAVFCAPARYHSRSDHLELFVETARPVSSADFEALIHNLKLHLHTDVQIVLTCPEKTTSLSLLEDHLSAVLAASSGLDLFRGKHPSLDETGTLRFVTSRQDNVAAMQEASGALAEALAARSMNVDVVIAYEEPSQLAPSATVDPSQLQRKTEKPKKSEPAGTNKYRKSGPKYTTTAIRDLEDGMSNIAIEGRIFALEMRETRNGSQMIELYLSDDDDAMFCKAFAGRRLPAEELEKLRKGDWVRICGYCRFDTWKRGNVVSIEKIEPIRKPSRKDDAPLKRVEWHVHSSFSEMDGVCAIESFVQQAWDWGMPGIGLCDHNVVQAFPMAQHKVEALRKKDPGRDFKMLYGCEMSMVDRTYRTVFNLRDQRLEDAEYVVFDLETTGLSSRLDDIIEFGAVKMKEGEILDRRQFFINPNRTIPASISELTNISQIDVDSAKPIEEMFDTIRDFIGDAILVAHNATFDVGMLNAAARRLGREEFTNPVIDTLPAARSMMDLRSYRLGSVCRHYNVPYDGEGAHRADYDAEVLSQVFQHMLRSWGSEATLETVACLDSSSALRKNFEHHINVFARNKAGLKELFELVTLSHTKYLKYTPGAANVTGAPRIPRDELEKYHASGNLLFGSACQNGELFELAMTRSEQELLDAMDFYDYIEVQPLEVYRSLLTRRSIHNRQDLQKIVGFIIDAARKKGKPVLATGDCHYIDERQKRVRDVYINSKATGNGRHPLFISNPELRRRTSAPSQGFLTTGEMLQAFDWLDEETRREIVIDNPRRLMEQFEELFPIKDRLYPPEMEGSDRKLAEICYETAKKQYGDPLPEPVEARLKRELDAIIGAGYYVVYYISHLLVKKSNEDGYLVGSRGSVGSSFVATMSGITEVNPLPPHYLCPNCHHLEWVDDGSVHSGFDLPDKVCPECGAPLKGDGQDIPFETFLGFEGDKVPDIDLNFSGDYQASAHAFTKTIFGDEHVFRAGTVGTVQDKTAYGFVKGYEEEMGLEEHPFSEYKRLDLSLECAGVKRTTGQHPGGIVVVPLDMDVHDFTPVQYPANNPYAEWKTTHFDFHQIHDNILKFDILGHVDPTAMKMMGRLSGIDVTTLPMNDPETMSIFSSCEALGVDTTIYREQTGAAGIPEFGTKFVRGILELTRPTTFAELVSISGLSHGTDVWLNNAKDLIDNGTCTLRQVIGCRDDIMIDLIRYGLPSKSSFTIMESVRKGKGLKPEWEELMAQNKVPEWYVDSCKKIKYMFPKAHAVAYVMMAVRIAWFKVHMPRVYYCQYFSIRCDAYDLAVMTRGQDAIQKRMYEIQQARAEKGRKVEPKEIALYDTLELANEMYARGYRFSPLSITRSDAREYIPDSDDEKAIIPPFTSVDSLGENVARSIVAAREQGEFLSKEDLLNRTSLSKTLLDRLDGLGALEGLDEENQLTLF